MHAFLAVVMAVVTTVIPEPQADRHYVLMTSGRDHCLDLVDGVGPAIIHFRCHRGWQQQWTLTSDPGQITPRWEIKFKADPRKLRHRHRGQGHPRPGRAVSPEARAVLEGR